MTFPAICSPIPATINIDDYPHLQDLELAENFDSNDAISVLIGSNYYWAIVNAEVIKGESGPTAINSKFGWRSSNRTNSNLIISDLPHPPDFEGNDAISMELRRFWETESIGIKPDGAEIEQQMLKDNTEKPVFYGRYYEVNLPCKEDYTPSSSNYRLCETRLNSLYHKLKKDHSLLRDYNNIIRDQEKRGIVERVQEEVSNPQPELVPKAIHYSPHHAVIHSEDVLSLNDCLEIGENHIPRVFDQLVKFRWNAVGLTADIEKAFLMVVIKPDDRDMLRFLWYEDPFVPKPKVVQYRFNRLLFGLRPSPSILGTTIKHHLLFYKQSEPEMFKLLQNCLYVDDLITGEENDEKAQNVYTKSKRIMAAGGFNLRKWHSNSRNLLKYIENCEVSVPHSSQPPMPPNQVEVEDDQSYAKSTITGDCENQANSTVKVLGLNWDTVPDKFFFNLVRFRKWEHHIR